MPKVSEEMTKDVVRVSPNDTVLDAAKKMKAASVGTVVIADNANKPLGIVTDRKLATDVLAEQKDPATTKVRDLAPSAAFTVSQDADVCDAVQSMSNHDVRRMPVVDNQERVVGVLSAADIAKEHAKECDRCTENILSITSKYA
ncbi:MAG TPA: CBS domain-containing protein [Nitrososphaerales archaeon]|nr:CBS domain-containing protein [Nitrososphaerales archaeon]